MIDDGTHACMSMHTRHFLTLTYHITPLWGETGREEGMVKL